jgi:hypothetical protein
MMEQQNSMTQACSSGKALSTILLIFWLLGAAVAQKAPEDFDSKQLPRVFCLSPVKLAESKVRVRQADKSLEPAMEKLRMEADEALKAGPFSVMDKQHTPPSGDKHDYMSLGPYWWPDPDKRDGLPYIRRDGRVNPETRTTDTDRPAFGQMSDAVETLSLAWYFTDHRPYAAHAAKLLRVWFLDEATAMNPNLEFGQAIPGRTLGRDIGIIDTARLTRIVDAVGLLESSDAWTPADRSGMRRWCTEYLKWLRTSNHGLGEEKQPNNHGTWYDAQVVSLALFIGQAAPARTVLEQVKSRRIDKHIEPDGRQPRELARTKSLGYSTMNLDGLFRLATMAQKAGVDLWHYESADGRSLRKALDYLAPYADSEKTWPHEQIAEYSPAGLFALLRRGSIVYSDERYEFLIAKMPAADRIADRTNLLWPRD